MRYETARACKQDGFIAAGVAPDYHRFQGALAHPYMVNDCQSRPHVHVSYLRSAWQALCSTRVAHLQRRRTVGLSMLGRGVGRDGGRLARGGLTLSEPMCWLILPSGYTLITSSRYHTVVCDGVSRG